MDALGESWFSLAARRMDWATARQKVLAENIANADTPDYVGRDVASFEDHLAKSETRGAVGVETAGSSWGGSFDGNQVVLEEQMVLSRETASKFALASSLYRKGHDLIGIAASGR